MSTGKSDEEVWERIKDVTVKILTAIEDEAKKEKFTRADMAAGSMHALCIIALEMAIECTKQADNMLVFLEETINKIKKIKELRKEGSEE